jgi:hypothetical protein
MEHFITDWGVEEKAAGQFQILRARPLGFARGRLFTSLENASFRMTVFFLKEVDLLLLSSWVLVDCLTKES